MEHPFSKSLSTAERVKRLSEVVGAEDALCILINADPDAMASALALKRFFWRRVRRVSICHVNEIQRADNLAFVRLLRIVQVPLKDLKPETFTRWAIVDGQPGQHEHFIDRDFDIIIDHHPFEETSKAKHMDIRDQYGATSTIMTEYLRGAGIRPSPRLATALYYGIKTDTDNFVRESVPNDINAFRYLYQFANTTIIKKIESSEMTMDTLDSYRKAIDRLVLVRDTGFIHMGNIENQDSLVMIADFFMRLVETTRCVVSGEYGDKLIVIIRNAGFRGNAGKTVQRVFSGLEASAGGHKSAARAEVPLTAISGKLNRDEDVAGFLRTLFTGRG
ncbi:MAG TPA: exopolyphosphatase [Desulfobacteraceae bacterium]|nr:exopolyphosphatase [Desulfobacteraceae bacterium]